MQLNIDSEYCQAHGQCAAAAPGLVRLDDEGYGQVVVSDIPDELLDTARLAARSCPEGAVTVD